VSGTIDLRLGIDVGGTNTDAVVLDRAGALVAKAKRATTADVTGGTFTITNLGMYNVDAFNAIILPPQAAILAVGRISDRVVAVNGQPAVRPMMTLTLSGDHRVVDGAQAAMFLNDLAEAIRLPGQWIENFNYFVTGPSGRTTLPKISLSTWASPA